MNLSIGSDRGRMNEKIKEWKTAFLLTGETPCTGDTFYMSGGAINRIIDVNCSDNIITDGKGNEVVKVISENYGFAGEKFLDAYKNHRDEFENIKNQYFDMIKKKGITSKQAESAALVCASRQISSSYIFGGNNVLSTEFAEILSGYLKTDDDVDISIKAYDYVKDFIAMNYKKFNGDEYEREIWGKISNFGFVFIIKSKLVEILKKSGYNFDAIKQKLSERGFIKRYKERYSTSIDIIGDNHKVRCVCFSGAPDMNKTV